MTALPDYKDIVQLIKKGATLEAQEKIMELREAALNLQEENLKLRLLIKELEEKLGFVGNMVFKKPFYYLDGDETPYCPTCWETKHSAIHLQGPEGAHEYFKCSVCKFGHYLKGRPRPNCKISTIRI